MEKGVKTLQSAARSAQRKAMADSHSVEGRGGISDHNSDSGIGFGSDAEMEVGEPGSSHRTTTSWNGHSPQHSYQEHSRSRSLPQPLPLYQPPPPIRRRFEGAPTATSPPEAAYGPLPESRRCSPESQNGRGGISIQSVLLN